MLLSTQQKFILETLRTLKCVRRRQLHALVRGRFEKDSFEVAQARMDAMLRQLRMGTFDVRMDNIIYLSDRNRIVEEHLHCIDTVIGQN